VTVPLELGNFSSLLELYLNGKLERGCYVVNVDEIKLSTVFIHQLE
jgi:hypothetical protein